MNSNQVLSTCNIVYTYGAVCPNAVAYPIAYNRYVQTLPALLVGFEASLGSNQEIC